MENLHLAILIVIFFISLSAVIKGADWLISGCASLARRLHVSELVIGLTVIALGTSLPELVVSVKAAMTGSASMAYSNVIGSNITNILLVLGVSAILAPMKAPLALLKRDLQLSLVAVSAFLAIVTWQWYGAAEDTFMFPRWGGGVLLLCFAGFVLRLLLSSGGGGADDDEPESGAHPVALVLLGLVFLIIGGDYTVESAVAGAKRLGVSETTIGLTIIALGTSLPELVASLTAAKRGLNDMAIGNVIGSNLMNLTLVLGTSSALRAVEVGFYEYIDTCWMVGVTLVFLSLLRRRVAAQLDRRIGLGFVSCYIGYMIFVALR